MTPTKTKRREIWRGARAEQEKAYQTWLSDNAADIAKLPRAKRAELKKAKWASMNPPPPAVAKTPRSEGQEERKARWRTERAEAVAVLMGRLR